MRTSIAAAMLACCAATAQTDRPPATNVAGIPVNYDEAKVDRVFTNSVFWVVTRTNDCFY